MGKKLGKVFQRRERNEAKKGRQKLMERKNSETDTKIGFFFKSLKYEGKRKKNVEAKKNKLPRTYATAPARRGSSCGFQPSCAISLKYQPISTTDRS